MGLSRSDRIDNVMTFNHQDHSNQNFHCMNVEAVISDDAQTVSKVSQSSLPPVQLDMPPAER